MLGLSTPFIPKAEGRKKDWELVFERVWEVMFTSRSSHVDSHGSLARWLAGSQFVKTLRHVGLANAKGYDRARVKRYPNSESTFQLIRLATSGDISVNPGPAQEKHKCQTCSRTIARNHRVVICGSCGSKFHIKCGNVTTKQHKALLLIHQHWFCSCCITWNDKVNPLSFACVLDESFASLFREQEQHRKVNSRAPDVLNLSDNYLLKIASDLDTAPTDLRITHLNTRSLRNKIEEVRLLQRICRFDRLGIIWSHLNSSDADHDIFIDGYKFILLDRSKCGGRGCVSYYADRLKG